MVIRFMVGALVLIVILLLFGQSGAAHSVANGALGIIKWIVIIGVIIFIIVGISSNKK